MFTVELPGCDPDELHRRLWDGYCVEATVFAWEGKRVLRVSVVPYTTEDDVDRLLAALAAELPRQM